MRASMITVAIITLSVVVSAAAKQEKAEEFAVTKTSNLITLSSAKVYDKYIITVVGDNGFSYQIESSEPTLNIDEMTLPYDGSYSYEIQAVDYIAEAVDTQNNGRNHNSIGKQSLVDVSNGQFSTDGYSIQTFQKLQEPKFGALPFSDTDK